MFVLLVSHSMYHTYPTLKIRFFFHPEETSRIMITKNLRNNFRQQKTLRFISMEAAARKSHAARWQEAHQIDISGLME